MSDDIDLDDAALLSELASATAAQDPVPQAVLAAAKASLTWRTIDSELAALAFDSSVDEAPVLVRGTATLSDAQLFTFETGLVSVDLQVTPRDGGFRLVGQLAPARVADIEVRSSAGVVGRVTSDDLGRVPALDVPAGPFSLRIKVEGEPHPVVTDWVTL